MKNHYEIIGEYAKVYSNGKRKDLFFFIDKEDLPIISEYSWRCYINKDGYHRVETSINIGGLFVKHFALARLLMNFPDGKMVDHRDCNPFNNRRSNLRVASSLQNSQNVPKTKSKTYSKYKGVSWHKNKNKWIASVSNDKKAYHLGYFINEIDAAIAYNQKAKELHGEFAKLNNFENFKQ